MDINHKKLGIYPGSFNPFHVGHFDIVKQSMAVFDEVLIAQGENPEKSHIPKYPLPTHLFNGYSKIIGVTKFNGLLTDEVTEWEKGGYNVTLIRGLRTVVDLTEEQNYIAFLRSLKPDIKICYFLCKPEFQHISSKALRGLEQLAPLEFRKHTF